MSTQRIAWRTCSICRTKADKRQLVRLVSTPQGIMIDPSGKQQGRGAYLCRNPQCWQQAANSSVLAQALRTTLSDTDRQTLRQYLS